MQLLVGALLILAVGCAGPAASTPPTAASNRVTVSLTDAMRIEPEQMTVPAGQPITFVVTNTGAVDHEFTVGDEEVQDAHEQEMLDMPGMAHDEDNSIIVPPGETKELVYTFDAAGSSLAGCHIPGHYPAGMKATITIT